MRSKKKNSENGGGCQSGRLHLLTGALLAIVLLVAVPVFLGEVVLNRAGAATEITPAVVEAVVYTSGQAMQMLDPAQPPPSLQIRLHVNAEDGYDLQLLTENFTFVPASGPNPNLNAQGHAQLYLNGRKVQSIYSSQAHLRGDYFSDGLNTIVVTLNAADSAFWTWNGSLVMDEIGVVVTAPTALPASTGQITYQFGWHWGDAQPDTSGQGWSVTNNLGYRIHVTQGYLVTATAEMVACPHDHTTSLADNTTLVGKLLDLFGPHVAYAGHGNDQVDASRIATPVVESLRMPMPLMIKATLGTEPFYCQTHYLIAHGVDWAAQLPSDVDMVGKSLLLAGEYWAPGTTTATPFMVQTEQAWGVLADVMAPTTADQAASPIALPHGQDIVIAITREVGSLFDGVDFINMTDAEQATTVLRGLANSVSVQALPVVSGSPTITGNE